MYNYKSVIIDKKAQVGETVSWIIATIIVVGILTIFIVISILVSKTKVIGTLNLQLDTKEVGVLEQKTSFSNQLAGDKNKQIIDNILKNG